MQKKRIQAAFVKKFQLSPELMICAPGRINLIGEHTDYNGGFVLPTSIDKAIWFAASKRTDNNFAFYAVDIEAFFLTENATISFQKEQTWVNYLFGAISELEKEEHQFSGLNIAFGGDIPMGAGLSSSAALESGILFIINELYCLGLSKMEIIHLAQRGENNFVGMQCGIMDMFASVMGKSNNFLRIDCRNLEYEYFPFQSDKYSLILIDTCVKHKLVDSEYNTRRSECEEGVAHLQLYNKQISTLRDVPLELLLTHKDELRPVVFQRCKYVIEEINRVEKACIALQQNDFEKLGKLIYETHDGLNVQYEVSCPEANFLVEKAHENSAILGARMMGGGFGGCVLYLIDNQSVKSFSDEITNAYFGTFGFKPKIYNVKLEDGVKVVETAQKNNPLHGITLERIITDLVDYFGWEYMASRVKINCFISEPSIKSSLKFLRKTPWAREKVEQLYLEMLEEITVNN